MLLDFGHLLKQAHYLPWCSLLSIADFVRAALLEKLERERNKNKTSDHLQQIPELRLQRDARLATMNHDRMILDDG